MTARYYIGFDLGTHQTKICIMDALNSDDKFYEFMEFETPQKGSSPLFPSIVQINEDKTVSYGYVDPCLQMADGAKPQKPMLQEMPSKPRLPDFEEPNYPEEPAIKWMDKLRALLHFKTSHEVWEQECKTISDKARKEWREKCDMINSNYASQCDSIMNNNEEKLEHYRKELAKWDEEGDGEYVFRYFKQKAFSGKGIWESELFSAEEVTVWYIAYILLLIKGKIGDAFVVQFGVPIGNYNSDDDKQIKERAYCLYVAAYHLYKKYADVNAYREASYEELREGTQIATYLSVEEKEFFDDLPEAYAGLFPLTDCGYIKGSFNLLVDIGGGTTDMALFCLDSKKNQPNVIMMESIQKGLNYIFEKSSDGTLKSIRKMQEKFFNDSSSSIFTDSIEEYQKELDTLCRELSDRLWKEMNRTKLPKSNLIQALKNQRVIYCGGGGVYEILHQDFPFYTDVKCISKELLKINNLINEDNIPDNLYPILATSYGLASFQKSYPGEEVKCSTIEEVFMNMFSDDTDKSHRYDFEYGMTDT